MRLLRLTGKDEDEDTVVSLSTKMDRALTYEKYDPPWPVRSHFLLNRRQAKIALNDTEQTLVSRVQRTKEIWFDPTFEPPESFVEEVRAKAALIDVDKLGRTRYFTIEDHEFKEVEPALARCAPEMLAELIRRKMRSAATCPPESRNWRAVQATDHLLLADEAEAQAAQALRLRGRESDERKESIVANKLLCLELQHLEAHTQVDILIQADLNSISRDFCEVLRPLPSDDIDALISRYAFGSPKQQVDLLTLLSCHFP